jgi:CheY-like chemotaxis protein
MAEKLGTRSRILVVDDDPDTRLLMKMMLACDGYEVSLAGDGEQAWTSLAETIPDLLLSDIMMPELDGLGLLRRIRAHPVLRALPVILLTAQAGIGGQAEAFGLGADDYMIKPFQKAEFLARVRSKILQPCLPDGSPPSKERLQ